MTITAVGFTSTRYGLTIDQSNRLFGALHFLRGGAFHHGDCIGGDAQGAVTAASLGYVLVCHPPTDMSRRAFVPSSIVRPALPYLERNNEIVRDVDVLIGCPAEDVEQRRGGTWYTIRRAREAGRELLVIGRTGQIIEWTPAR